MGRQSPLIRSFNAGEWSQLMAGRTDLDKYSASCRVMENFIPTPQGAAIARSGTGFVARALSDGPCAIYPFQFSTVQSCLLVFSAAKLAFATNDGFITTGDGETPYTLNVPYAAEDVANIRYTQKNDVLYLFCEGYPVYKLSRFATLDWRFEAVEFVDGPWLDTNYANNHITLSQAGQTGKANFTFTADQSGSAYNGTGTATWYTTEGGATAATTLKGYQVIIPQNNTYTVDSTIYSAKDMAPVTWTLYGSVDNTNWDTIDRQVNFVDYQSGASDWIPVYPSSAYIFYKLRVDATYNDAPIPPNIQDILLTANEDPPLTAHFDNTTNINFGNGFVSTDVGRLIRVKRTDGAWVSLKITAVNGPLDIGATVQQAPFLTVYPTTFWRLGLFCQTNGYPRCGTFFAERLWMGGCDMYPDTVVASEVSAYETMQPDDPRTGDVSDSDAINVTLESRSQVLWMTSDDRGIVMGTAAGEWTIQSGNSSSYTTASVITPTSLLARNPTQRGSSAADCLRIDHQVLYLQRSGRNVRAMEYSFQIDGYSNTALSTAAQHRMQPSVAQLVYQATPYSLVWGRRSDGKLLSLTFMPDEQVSGWAYHDVGGSVDSLAVIPSPDGQQDTVFMIVKRQVGNITVRYLERFLRNWDFDMTPSDAAFVDCATIDTSLSQTISVPYLALTQGVYALIDGKTVAGPFTVPLNGNITLPVKPRQQVVIGIGYFGQVVTQRQEAGTQAGTAQGKIKRIDRAVFRMWQTGAGTVGAPPSLNQPLAVDVPITFTAFSGVLTPSDTLHDFDFPFVMPPGSNTDGSVRFTKRVQDLLPINVVSITLWLETEESM